MPMAGAVEGGEEAGVADRVAPTATVAFDSEGALDGAMRMIHAQSTTLEARRARRRMTAALNNCLDAETAQQACASYARTRDRQLRDAIVERHQWLVRICVKRFLRGNATFDDLMQVANIGLINALDRYDPAVGAAFRTYASATIIGELRRHYRTVWMLRVPRSLQERHLAVRGAVERLQAELSRTPTAMELASFLAVSVAEVIEAQTVGARNWVEPLSHLERADGGIQPASATDQEDAVVSNIMTTTLLQRLPPRERALLTLLHVTGLTQEQAGKQLGMTQVQVSRLARRSLERLRLDRHAVAAS
jgi:RNA polymerase sigma-B factor